MQLPRVYLWTNIAEAIAGELSATASHSVLIPFEGEAATSDGEELKAHAYVLPPQPNMAIENAPGKSWSGFRIWYEAVELTRPVAVGQLPADPDPLAPAAKLPVFAPVAALRMSSIARELHRCRMLESEGYRLHALFQELIYLLLESISAVQGEADTALQAVRDSIAYIEQSFSTGLSHAKLAERSRLSLRHYSRLFRQLTGSSPMQYVTGRRLEAAQRLLLTGNETIQHVASHTGFSDSFHFSRAFKQHTGVSPRLFVQLRRERSRMVAYQYLGELLTLGIRPVGAPGLLLGGKFMQANASGIGNIGQTVTMPDILMLKQLGPDAIITFDGHHYDDYMRIAPTLDIPWLLPAAERFRLLAARLGKEQEAEGWLRQFQAQIEQARDWLYPLLGDQTVSFWWMRGLPGHFDVYFIQELFYSYLQLPPPPAVQRVWEAGGYPFKRSVPISELPHYAGDRLFIVVGPDEENRLHYSRLCESELWRSIAAVQAGRVHLLTPDWLYGDPISLEGQLGELPVVMQQL